MWWWSSADILPSFNTFNTHNLICKAGVPSKGLHAHLSSLWDSHSFVRENSRNWMNFLKINLWFKDIYPTVLCYRTVSWFTMWKLDLTCKSQVKNPCFPGWPWVSHSISASPTLQGCCEDKVGEELCIPSEALQKKDSIQVWKRK